LDCSKRCTPNVPRFEASSQRLAPPGRNSFRIGRQTTKQKSIPTERGSWKQRQNPRRLLVLFRARCTCFLFSRAILANTSPEIRERLGETQRRNKSLRQQKYFKLLVLHIGSRKTFADSVGESRCLGDGSIHGDRARVGCSTVGADSLPSPITERVSTGWRRAD